MALPVGKHVVRGDMMSGFVRAVDAIAVACAVMASILLVIAVVVVSWMVGYRAFGFSAYWEIEFATYLMVAAVFLGSPYCLKTRGHVSVDLLPAMLPARWRRRLALGLALLGVLTCLFLTWIGAELSWKSWSAGETTNSLWAPPRWPLFLTMPVGLGLTALQYLAEILRRDDERESGS